MGLHESHNKTKMSTKFTLKDTGNTADVNLHVKYNAGCFNSVCSILFLRQQRLNGDL